MMPEKLPQVHGLPTGSGSTKHKPPAVEHFELACVSRIPDGGVAGVCRSDGGVSGEGGVNG